jgi:hypothetical protein
LQLQQFQASASAFSISWNHILICEYITNSALAPLL